MDYLTTFPPPWGALVRWNLMGAPNRLICGDNLEILRQQMADQSVDLCYIDPPFHSRRAYRTGADAAFTDIWRWDSAAERGLSELPPGKVALLLQGFEPVIGRGSLLAYLVSVALRVGEIYRVLRPTGSLFLHCDPTASHYLKLILDAQFAEPGGFRNEIVWCYSHGGRSRKWFGRKHDIIFYYAKSDESRFDPAATRIEMRSGTQSFGGRLLTEEGGRKYRLVYGTRNAQGEARYYKYYLDEGKLPEDWWADINSLQASAAERTGYPTQKPEALLRRIVAACSRPGDVVLDAYCGSGTTLVAAERGGRQWIGIDLAEQAIALTKERLQATFGAEILERVVCVKQE
jgi:site-specific DNA-methyltransferase (adenine-specific)